MKSLFIIIILCNTLFANVTAEFEVKGMHCPLCTTAVKKAIKKLDGIKSVSARLNTKKVTVVFDESQNIKNILDAIKTTSYEGVLIKQNTK